MFTDHFFYLKKQAQGSVLYCIIPVSLITTDHSVAQITNYSHLL